MGDGVVSAGLAVLLFALLAWGVFLGLAALLALRKIVDVLIKIAVELRMIASQPRKGP